MKAVSRGNSKSHQTPQKDNRRGPNPKYDEYDEDEVSDEVNRSSGKPSAVQPKTKGKQQEYDEQYDEVYEEEPVTAEYLEQSLITTIKEFGTYVASITRDLERQEQEYIDELKATGKKVPRSIWADSTFKVEFTQGVLLKFFEAKVERLMKYYIVILLPMKKWITKRKEKFFLEAQVFPGAPEEDIKFFRALWGIDGAMTPEEKQTSWEFWDTQIEIVEDWWALTGWKPNPNEKLQIPNVDYEKAARDAQISDSE